MCARRSRQEEKSRQAVKGGWSRFEPKSLRHRSHTEGVPAESEHDLISPLIEVPGNECAAFPFSYDQPGQFSSHFVVCSKANRYMLVRAFDHARILAPTPERGFR